MDKPLVLVVDDELSFRLFLKTLFETGGFEAVMARNGDEAMDRAKGRRPDLVVLDVMMPLQGGLETYRRLREDPGLAGVPVIMLSAVAARTFSHALTMLGLDGTALPEPFAYVEKPPRPETLLGLAQSAAAVGRQPLA